ncbi:hypothetical protein KAJ83_12920 [Marivibrio halodurans]|uniref:Uncharacterized protein n=1 Tax=Marivibrio halodurans TaxID=2039722 RepID=A0A8J7V4P7_9PROT|nr:hypothetical protein [Marivibrio halodurans]MBP5857914.1 hypothetical protein [Marivibrio halodurans]
MMAAGTQATGREDLLRQVLARLDAAVRGRIEAKWSAHSASAEEAASTRHDGLLKALRESGHAEVATLFEDLIRDFEDLRETARRREMRAREDRKGFKKTIKRLKAENRALRRREREVPQQIAAALRSEREEFERTIKEIIEDSRRIVTWRNAVLSFVVITVSLGGILLAAYVGAGMSIWVSKDHWHDARGYLHDWFAWAVEVSEEQPVDAEPEKGDPTNSREDVTQDETGEQSQGAPVIAPSLKGGGGPPYGAGREGVDDHPRMHANPHAARSRFVP